MTKEKTTRGTVTVRIEKALVIALKKAAKADDRSVNSYMEALLRRELTKKV